MADNAFAFGQLLQKNPKRSDVEAVRAFNVVMAKESALRSVIVPIGDGLWVGVKV
jgi:predicted O-methyltransferase YrrM